MSIDFNQMQNEHAIWVTKNFPNQPTERPLLGAIEELGELCHAELKLLQGIRGDSEKHITAAKDAVGDVIIYLFHYCTLKGFNLSQCMMDYRFLQSMYLDKNTAQTLLNVNKYLGKLSKTELKLLLTAKNNKEKLIEKVKNSLGELMNNLFAYCDLRGFKLEECLQTAFDEVMKRDWTKNKENGSVENVLAIVDGVTVVDVAKEMAKPPEGDLTEEVCHENEKDN